MCRILSGNATIRKSIIIIAELRPWVIMLIAGNRMGLSVKERNFKMLMIKKELVKQLFIFFMT